jgi:DNA processing protein
LNEREACVALNMMDRIGPVGVRSLIDTLGSVLAIFSATRDQLRAARGIGSETAEAIVSQRDTLDWCGELARAEGEGIRIITQPDAEYPSALKQIHDPPLALYVRGELQSRDRHAVAVVGTRRPTMYGRETTARLTGQLARCGLTIVSGLAEGVDTAAHDAALSAGGRTLAVIGSGMDCLYPPGNRALADRIAAGQGAVISEFPFGRKPDKTTFPIRNRIVSGLSMGVLVVEAGATSGALITVRQALDQNRAVFAVPGRIDSNASQGSNNLLKQGAQCVTCAEDVLSSFEMLIPPSALAPEAKVRPAPALSESETVLVTLLRDGVQDVDGLIRRSGIGAADIGSVLVGLEMKRVARMRPGRVVELIGG